MSDVAQPAVQDTPNPAAGTSAASPAPAAQAQDTPKPAEAQPAAADKAPAPDASKAAADTKAAEAKPAEDKKDAEPAKEEKPAVPEKYDLKLPKDSALSPAHVEKLSAYAKEKGLSNDQAQVLLERENSAVSDYVSGLKETQTQMVNEWVKQAQADKELGGEAFKQNAELAKRVVDRFGTDDFKKELSKTGLGNHPELLRVFNRIGKAMSEDQLILPGKQASDSRSTAELLYGSSEKKGE